MKEPWTEIPVTALDGFEIGNAEYTESGTGCTVILAGRKGAVTGLDVRGGGPASRESALLNLLAMNDAVHAVVLSGGSAFGLDSASGVMKYLEEHQIGFPTDYGIVPIVCASCLFDLPVGKRDVRPDASLGYQACLNAGNFRSGNYGAGTGASCGKAYGMEHAMKSGIGAYALAIGSLKIGAIVAVNALGNIIDPSDGKTIAGCHDDSGFIDENALFALSDQHAGINAFVENTTIGAILTNADLNKTELTKVAGMAHDGYARAINPVHTMNDGDSIYAMSTAEVKADISLVGMLAAVVMERAILDAARSAASAYGLKGLAG